MTVVVVTRPRESFDAALEAVERMGWRAIGAPTVEIRPRAREAIARFRKESEKGRFDLVVLTSANGVRMLHEADGRFLRSLAAPVSAVGPRTAQALKDQGLAAEVPRVHSSEGLVEHLKARVGGKRVALLRSDHGAPALADGLEAAGASVVDIPVYHIGMPRDLAPATRLVQAVASQGADAFTFTSTLTFRNFLEIARKANVGEDVALALSRGVVGAIGEPTRRVVEEAGFEVHAVPEEASFDELLAAVRRALARL
ncbi:MAG TPA: uroporphyrinogen-III synthase [Candidatus Thermoplasmatota archaeon]|nr:uroporphyrinogen-III synthase [Candidatus Thermoplasmatota archaeon]